MESTEFEEFKSVNANSFNDPFLNIPLTDIDIGRESIPILDLSSSFGRESIGILQFGADFNDINANDQYFNISNPSNASSNVLDKGFLITSRKLSEYQSVSSMISNVSSKFSFDINDLDRPSTINSLGSYNSVDIRDSLNALNKAFVYSTNAGDSPLSKYRSRFYSLPVYNDNNGFDKNKFIEELINKVSEGCQKLNRSIIKSQDTEQTDGDGFNDSVFIEARHLTGKFSEEGSNDGYILDDTNPPELLENLEESKCDQKCDSKDVLKKIDALLPVSEYQKLNEKLDNRPKHTQSLEPTNSDEKTEPEEKSKVAKANDEVDKKEDIRIQEAGSDKEKSKKLLNALSEILLKDDRSDKDTEKGQNLLNTLGDMLHNKPVRSKSLTFNGGPDISTQTSKMIENSHLAKSQVSKTFKGSLTNSLGRSHSSVSGASEASLEVKNFSTESMKLKKNSSVSRRGPMKAIIPMENLIKPLQKVTPPRPLAKLSRTRSRISTPIRETQLRPMAQSTPDTKINGRVKETNASFGSVQEKSSNNSMSINSLSSYKDSSNSKDVSSLQNSRLPRRSSFSGVKTLPADFKRSNSFKETSLMKAMCKIRQNISNSAELQKKDALRDCSNTSEKNDSSGSKKTTETPRKMTDTPRKMIRTSGKENSLVVY